MSVERWDAEVGWSAPRRAAADDLVERIYARHYRRVQRYCRHRLGDDHEAHDVAQETFARAIRALPAGLGEDDCYPWLRVVARNLCTDAMRRRDRTRPAAAVEVAEVAAADDRLGDREDLEMVRQALGRVSARHREALLMRERDGLTYEQMAARTGTTTGTVESVLWRARQSLRREFLAIAGPEGLLVGLPVAGWLLRRAHRSGRHAIVRARELSAWTGGLSPAGTAAVVAGPALVAAMGVGAVLLPAQPTAAPARPPLSVPASAGLRATPAGPVPSTGSGFARAPGGSPAPGVVAGPAGPVADRRAGTSGVASGPVSGLGVPATTVGVSAAALAPSVSLPAVTAPTSVTVPSLSLTVPSAGSSVVPTVLAPAVATLPAAAAIPAATVPVTPPVTVPTSVTVPVTPLTVPLG